MSILINKNTKVITQGITGATGLFHAQGAREYGTQMVGGVTPGKGGTDHRRLSRLRHRAAKPSTRPAPPPRSSTCRPPLPPTPSWKRSMPASNSSAASPKGFRSSTWSRSSSTCRGRRPAWSAPTAPASSPPASARSASCPATSTNPGKVGVVSRSGTLTYEAVWQLTCLGLGQSTCVGIGGDPVNGTNHLDVLRMFEDDPDTEAVIMIGEIGGTAEEEAAYFVKEHMTKPVAAFIAGVTAPPGKRMGHAGAIISGGKGTAAEKVAVLEECGISVAASPAEMAQALLKIYKP